MPCPCNLDAFVISRTGTGLGVDFRDHSGKVLVAVTKFLPIWYPPRIAEALTLQWAIDTSLIMSLNRIVFEIDCQRLVNVWTGNFNFVEVVQDSPSLLNMRSNVSISLSYVNRNANMGDNNKLASLAFTAKDLVGGYSSLNL